MTEAEKRNFFALASSRGPGKRQIKPNTNILLDSIPLIDSDEDDDFVVTGKTDNEVSDSNSNSSSGEDEENDESDNESTLASRALNSTLDMQQSSEETKQPEMGVISASVCNIHSVQLICTLCLNQRAAVRNDEIIQCDKCGLAVHENCYVNENAGDSESNGSSASTEPWFCEPCLYGLREPPYCELCPNRFGAFKKSDIGGGWVHLLCGLYTSGVTFGDVDRLSFVSWQELDYRMFGKRACIACSDPLLARTGIAVPCEAALCKSHLHVTCAQRLGLLVDNTERTADPNLSSSSNSNNVPETETVHPFYLTCKRHGNENLMKQRKAACELLYKQEEARMLGIRRRTLNEREERKRLEMLQKHKETMKNLEGITIAWPEHDEKRPRLLHTSAQYLELFMEKAESSGTSRKEFVDNFIKIDGAQLPYLPPGFSSEFIQYFNHRDKNVIPEETRKLETLKRENENLREEQKKLQEELHIDYAASAVADSNMVQEWYETLHALGLRKLKKPTPGIENKTKKNPLKKAQSLESATNPSTSDSITWTKLPSEKKEVADNPTKIDKLVDLKINFCDECKKTTEQHLMTQCDSCNKYYHLTCLEPPLPKMPKKTSTQGWMCSLCCDVNSDSDTDKVKKIDIGPRKLRDRSFALEKRKEEEKAERKAFQAAVRPTRQSSVRKRKSNTVASSAVATKTASFETPTYSTPYSKTTATTSKCQSWEHSKKNTFGDLNGVHQRKNAEEKIPSMLLVPGTPKRKSRSSVNS